MTAYVYDFEHNEQTFRIRLIAEDREGAERMAEEIQPDCCFWFIREEAA